MRCGAHLGRFQHPRGLQVMHDLAKLLAVEGVQPLHLQDAMETRSMQLRCLCCSGSV